MTSSIDKIRKGAETVLDDGESIEQDKGLNEKNHTTELRKRSIDEEAFVLETPAQRVGFKEPRELLAPKSLGFPKDREDAKISAGGFAAEQYLGRKFSDEDFTDHLLYELWRRKEKFEDIPEEGIFNAYESCKAQKDDVFRVLGWSLGVGVGGSVINYLKAGLGPGLEVSPEAAVVYGGYGFSSYGLYKGALADFIVVKDHVEEFSDSFDEQAELYEDTFFEVKEKGHKLDRLDVSHNPILDSERTGKYRLNGEEWYYDGPDTLYDRVRNFSGNLF